MAGHRRQQTDKCREKSYTEAQKQKANKQRCKLPKRKFSATHAGTFFACESCACTSGHFLQQVDATTQPYVGRTASHIPGAHLIDMYTYITMSSFLPLLHKHVR